MLTLKNVSSYVKQDNRLLIRVDNEWADIVFYENACVRLRISQAHKFTIKASSALVDNLPQSIDFSIEETKNFLLVTSEHLTVTVNKHYFSFTVQRLDGCEILAAAHDRPFYQFLNNSFRLNRHSPKKDLIYGLGEKTGRINHRGRKLTLWTTDILTPGPDQSFNPDENPDEDAFSTNFDPYYMSIPFYYQFSPHGSHASGHFIDNPYKGTFDFNEHHTQIDFNGGQYCEYVFAGPQIKDII
ncbi:MAG: DUF4968 domain-containing protein, partial [Lentisphaeraceae bacterium]|nr:DUF4968 domain-containing protein [Lentisphaeraceae bacterium]